jgi:hypothetical protein
LSVGAIYDEDVNFRDEPAGAWLVAGSRVFYAKKGRCAAFSQRLSAASGTVFRTDIFAPGLSVASAGPYVDGDDQKSMRGASLNDGTSRSAPMVAGSVLLLQEYYAKVHGSGRLPPVHIVEKCLIDGGVPFTDDEETPPENFDNVTGTGRTFVRLDVYGALTKMAERLQADATRARLRPGTLAAAATPAGP